MKYVALLRGVNVGGNNTVKMSVLKEVFEKNNYTNVKTLINSGNAIFESEETNTEKVTKDLEALLSNTFHYQARVLVKTQQEMEKVIKNVPQEWNTRDDLRCYIGFLLPPLTAVEAKKEIVVREGVDTLQVGPRVLYMTTLLKELNKSAYNKMVGTKVYKEMTIRNYNTSKKILALIE